MSWFKDVVEDWDMVGRTVAPMPPSAEWANAKDEEGEEQVAVSLGYIDLAASRDPNVMQLEKLKAETALILSGE